MSTAKPKAKPKPRKADQALFADDDAPSHQEGPRPLQVGDRVKIACKNPNAYRKGQVGKIKEQAQPSDDKETDHLYWIEFSDPVDSPLHGVRSPFLGSDLERVP